MNAGFVRSLGRWPVFLLPWLLLGCESISQSRSTSTEPPQRGLAYGYALLFDLLGDEKNVSKLLIIKRERPELKNLIKEISRTCADAHKGIETWAKAEPPVNLKDQGLPAAEVETRKAIGKTKAKELLTDKGQEFELRLLLTQNEALTYGAHLAATTAQAERDPKRSQFLQQCSRDLTLLQAKVMALLRQNYSWRGS